MATLPQRCRGSANAVPVPRQVSGTSKRARGSITSQGRTGCPSELSDNMVPQEIVPGADSTTVVYTFSVDFREVGGPGGGGPSPAPTSER